MSVPKRFLPVALVLCSAVLLLLAEPPLDWHPLYWLAWAPLFAGLSRAKDRREALKLGLLFGLAHFGLFFRWAWRVPRIAPLAATFFGALFGVGYAALFYGLRKRPRWQQALGGAALWVLPLFVADNPIHPFWGQLVLLDGIQSPLPLPFLNLASLVDEKGLVFFVLLVNALVWLAIEERARVRRICVATAAVLLLAACLEGNGLSARYVNAGVDPRKPFRVACAQHDLPFDWRWRATHQDEIFKTYDEMAAEAAKRGANFVLFPQYQLPEDIAREPGHWPDIARKNKIYVGLGTYTPDVPKLYGKDAWVITLVFGPDGQLVGSHRALHPSPFGRPMVLTSADANAIPIPAFGGLGVLPCFDDVGARETRLFGSGPDYFAAIANDTLFKGTIEPEVHLLRSRLRAIESGRYFIRCTPAGISAVIAPDGEVLDSLPSGRGLLVHDFPRK